MTWNFTILAVPLLAGTILVLGMTVLVIVRRPAHGAAPLAWLGVAVGLYVLGYAAELGSPTREQVALCLRVQYLGIANLPGLVLLLVLATTGLHRFLTPLRVAPLFVVPAITCVLALTSQTHSLIWRNLQIDTAAGFTRTFFERGPWYWVHNVYVYLPLAAAIVVLVERARGASGLFRRQTIVMLVGVLLPVAVHLAYLLSPTASGFDPNPYALLLTTIALAWATTGYRLWDLVPVAREAVLASMRDAVVVVDARDRVADLNPAAEGILDTTVARAIGRPVAEVLAYWGALLASGEGRLDVSLPVGAETRHFEASLAPLTGRRGRVEGRLVVLHDATERRQAEEQLRLQSVALESAANGIVITDRRGRMLWVNPAFSRMTGYAAEEVVGQNPRLLKSGAHEDAYYRGMWEAVLAGQVWHGETTNRRKDGSLYTEEQTIAPVGDPSGAVSHFIAIKQDVTERKRIEKLRDTLTSTTVHDLRNPLTVVYGSLQLLREMAEGRMSAEKALATLGLAEQAAEHMLTLLNTILDVASLQSGKMPLALAPLDLGELILGAVRFQAPLVEAKQQRLEADLPQGLLRVRADRSLMGRVLQNLIDNALKFTPAGGRVTVIARAATAPATGVTVSVTDNGPGIPRELQQQLFQEFVRGTLEGRGSGLGLAFCRLVVEAHGGCIWVESEPGCGATLSFMLPPAGA